MRRPLSMQILQVTSTYYPEPQFGGPPGKIHALSKGLVARGHRVTVLTFHSQEPRNGEAKEVDGIPVQYLPWIGRGLRQWPLGRHRIGQLVKRLTWSMFTDFIIFLAHLTCQEAHRQHKPFLLEPLGMYVPRGGNRFLKSVYHRVFTHGMIRHAAMLIATSLRPKRRN